MPAGTEIPNDVDFWYAWTGALSDPALWGRYVDLLPREELDQVERFRREPDRRRSLVARVLMRTAVSRSTGVEPSALCFTRDWLGKPELAEPVDARLSFNLSHTGELVVCAVSRRGTVGVDIERHQRPLDFLPLARRFFAADEVAALEEARPQDQQRAFFELWTLKEAYIKACGKGLTMPLRDFALRFGRGEPPTLGFTASGYGDPRDWRFAQIELAGEYQGAVALCSAAEGPLTVRLVDALPLVREESHRELPPCVANRWAV